jgi:hypothetical protein
MYPGLTPWANVLCTYGAGLLRSARMGSFVQGLCVTPPHFMVSFLRLAQQRKMPGFPTHIVGTPTIRGSFGFAQDKKAPSRLRASQRYKGSCKERCRAEAQRLQRQS